METTRMPLLRPEVGRRVGGVALGVAGHLGVSVRLTRIVFTLLVPVAGIGAALYVFLWVTVPSGDPGTAARDARPAALSRLARPQPAQGEGNRRLRLDEALLSVALLAGAAALIAVRSGASMDSTWVVPALLLLSGAALAWSQLDEAQRQRRSGSRRERRISALRLVGGLVIAGAGVLLLVGQDASPRTLLSSTVAAVAVLAGVALVLAPWWLRLVRELGDERAARARESERADIAAHLHDSVLQTLALIRARADDPTEVSRMARAQERELRAWLYDDRPAPGTSVADALRTLVADLEDTRVGSGGEAVVVDTVVVGDRQPDADTEALLQATREALVNAIVHGRPPVSLYLEVTDDAVEVFVRDRGDGFDPATIPSDRFGVRESILGRVRRRGGTADVRSMGTRDGAAGEQSLHGGGTEVRLRVPVRTEETSAVPVPGTAGGPDERGTAASGTASRPEGSPTVGGSAPPAPETRELRS